VKQVLGDLPTPFEKVYYGVCIQQKPKREDCARASCLAGCGGWGASCR